MTKVYCLNNISKTGLEVLDDTFEIADSPEGAEVILVRSAAMHDMEFDPQLKAIARAGAGVNNIPLDKCAEKGIVVFNTPGANANAVKELVIAGMMMAARDIIGGIDWVKENHADTNISKDMEKAKKNFAGKEISGKKLGVIGLGAIGTEVANACVKLGMTVYGYDPYISVKSAWMLSRSVHHAVSADDIYRECDYITVHVPAMDATKGMINKEALSKMKDGVVILNYARDVLVNDDDMKEALESGKVAHYLTDFPNPKVVSMKNVIATPHLGASTEEAEENCARMACEQASDYIKYGNIRNSVNYPNCDMGICAYACRLCILHKNIPNMIGQITAALAADNHNIANMSNGSRKEYAYTMIDLENDVPQEMLEKISLISGVLKVRKL